MSILSNEKKWKYLSFILIGILATGVFSTQAFGASPTLTDIMNKLIGLDNKATAIKAKTDNLPTDPASNTVVNTRASGESLGNLQTTANGIKAKTDNLPANPASSTLGLRINPSINPDDGGFEEYVILDEQSGKTYNGHITAITSIAGGNSVSLLCYAGSGSGVGVSLFSHTATNIESETINEDFACNKLTFLVQEGLDDINSSDVNLSATIDYVEAIT